MGSTSGFSADLNLDELLNVVDNGSGAVSVATRQAAVLTNLGLTVTQAELNALHGTNPGLNADLAGGSTLAVTSAMNGKVINLDTATGTVVTLPAATGSGLSVTFLVTVLATSNSHIIYTSSANGVGGTANNMIGLAFGARIDSGNAVLGFACQSTTNTITLNRTTTGSVSKGEYITVKDVAANTWRVEAFLTATGAAFATPFSHT